MLINDSFFIWISIGITALVLLIYSCTRSSRYSLGLKDNAEVKKLTPYVAPIQILTPSEIRMHKMILQSVQSGYHNVCQIAFTAFIKCDDMATRNSFSRLRADWIICTEDFTPIICLELDDPTHRFTKEKDDFRDNLLSAALIPTERFQGLPRSSSDVKQRISPYFKNQTQSASYKHTHKRTARKKPLIKPAH